MKFIEKKKENIDLFDNSNLFSIELKIIEYIVIIDQYKKQKKNVLKFMIIFLY